MPSSGSSRVTAVDLPSPSSPPPPHHHQSTDVPSPNKPPSTSSHMLDPQNPSSEISDYPSLKALGKRPERPVEQNQPLLQNLPITDVQLAEDGVQSVPPLSKPPPKKKSRLGSQVHGGKVQPEEGTKRRVLPQRNRRGGPGVGNSAIDTMILDSQQKSYDNQFIIPPDATFVITTDHRLVLDSTQGEEVIHQSHFSRPEIQAASREQALIETPRFAPLAAGAAVGSRLRARSISEEVVDTSDPVYIKRHRKYETFEKRQRLREKETLQYEHFKLRERIDELKSMDASAFSGLSIPGSGVSEAHPDHGEEAKRLMLKEAEELDRRYITLLPGSGDKKGQRKDGDDREASLAGSNSDIAGPGSGGGIRLRLKRGKGSFPAQSTTAANLARDSEEVEGPVEGTLVPPEGTDRTEFKEEFEVDGTDEYGTSDRGDYPLGSDQEQHPASITNTRRRRGRGGRAERGGRGGRGGSRRHSSPPVRKRIRLVSGRALSQSPNEISSSASPTPTSHRLPSPSARHSPPHARTAPPPIPLLIQAALKSATEPNAKRRQAPRGQQPFGVPFSVGTDVKREFELPSWIIVEGLEIRSQSQ